MVDSLILIALLSILPQFSHFNPLSLILKYAKLFFSLQFVHSSILGLNPIILKSLNLNGDFSTEKVKIDINIYNPEQK